MAERAWPLPRYVGRNDPPAKPTDGRPTFFREPDPFDGDPFLHRAFDVWKRYIAPELRKHLDETEIETAFPPPPPASRSPIVRADGKLI